MHKAPSALLRRGIVVAVAAVSVSLFVAACNDSTSIDPLRDRVPPSLTLTPVAGGADTVISFRTDASDNLGLKTIHVQAIGAVGFVYDTTFTSAVTSIGLPFTLFASRAVPPGTPVIVTAEATDGAGNSSGVDTLRLATGNVPPPEVRVISPTSGSSAVLGKSILVTVMGKTAIKVRALGLFTTGPVVRADSVIYSSPLRDSINMQDTIAIPANAAAGTLTITPFLRDSLGQRAVGPSITITVQTAAQVNSVPVVNQYCVGNQTYDNACGHGKRVEVTDTVHVEADDPSGIAQLGYEVRRTVGGAIDDSATFLSNGQLTFDLHTFAMKLPYTTFPTTAYIQVFARNANGVRAYAKLSSGADRIDTVTVVAGVTRPLPNGGQVADAFYHNGKDRLYLTNITRNQVEVFNLSDSSFKTPVIVGSRPWGLTVWPRDRNGAEGDTLLIANSGGTDISYIDLNVGANGAEVFRYALPNIIVYSVTTVTAGPSGLPFQQRTRYDFSDRPQFPAATCIAGAGVCSEVVLTYTTTPTPGQSAPFNDLAGTIRWENLTRGVTVAGKTDFRTSHFFFEPAMGQSANRSDTLEIVRFDANGVDTTVLVPYIQTVGTAPNEKKYSRVVRLRELGFRDTTFARNSGNFRRAIFGEGGSVFGSRAVSYDVDRGFQTTAPDALGVQQPLPIPDVDNGVSPSTAVSDFIANTFAEVKGVAINFDGSLSAIRADSTYVLNPLLRLQGVLNTTVSNAGLDFHPLNTGPNSFPLNTRLVFAASSEPLIEIFDTHCYQRVSSIPIRDPIIGPIKAAYRISSGELVLVGATARGVVIATLPNTFTTTCP
ncbi:MAG: YncE family protein [Gemmatimonadaceae bacterium]